MERGGDLEVRVGPGGEPAEDLEDRLLAEDEAAVGLLAGEDEAVEPGLEVRALDLVHPQRADARVARDGGQDRLGQVGVVQRVVRDFAGRAVPDGADAGVLEPLGQLAPQPDEDLVVVHRRAVRDGDDQMAQLRVAGRELGVRDDRQIAQPLPLAGEPALVA
jgi:hypothetical protein